LVLNAARNGSRCDCAETLNNLMDGSVLLQNPMGPRTIVLAFPG
jgi:hypothetical protein